MRFGAEGKTMKLRIILVSTLAAASLWACGGKASPPQTTMAETQQGSLYDRLGRRDAIAGVVKDFVEERVAKDDRIKAMFANADIPGLEAKLVDQICEASGGPCKYTGKDMKTAHAGMNIKDADFNALVEDLKASLDHFKVGPQEQKDLLGALAKMHDDIVTAK
jgi:hemoglobin